MVVKNLEGKSINIKYTKDGKSESIKTGSALVQRT
jgi:hypothetical protein